MPAVRHLRPDSVFSPAEWRRITAVSRWRGVWLVAHAWLVIIALAGLASWLAHPLAWLAAVLLIGGRQLGLAILMHEAAHGLLHPDRRINTFLGEWLTGAAVGSDLGAYRAYHLRHHRFTQQAEDPDLPLSAAFPTSRASLARKIARDLLGLSFASQRARQFALAGKGLADIARGRASAPRAAGAATGAPFNHRRAPAAPTTDHDGAAAVAARSVGRFLIVQLTLLAVSLLLWGWTPFLLWLAALATSFQLWLRLRNIAEHGCTRVGGDDPFTHARTTRAGWIERATVAPYWVNFHAEHHLFMAVPCHRLPEVHRLLGRGGYHPRMTVAPGYAAVLRLVTTSPSA